MGFPCEEISLLSSADRNICVISLTHVLHICNVERVSWYDVALGYLYVACTVGTRHVIQVVTICVEHIKLSSRLVADRYFDAPVITEFDFIRVIITHCG